MPELTAKTFLSTLLSTEILSELRIAEIEREFGEDCPPKTLAIQLVRSGELTSWQAKFLLSGREGLRVGNYILRERLSQDELGDRILAIHQRLDRPVDLQILPAEANENLPAFQGFLRHVSKAAHLDHPNLIHVYDIDREGGRYYLVSEHFEAQSLQQLFPAATNWYIVKIGSIARQLLGGIFYAHSESVVHGDIGPQTILVSSDGTAKVDNMAIAALHRVIGEHRSASPKPVNPTPNDDYRGFARALLQLMDAQCTPTTNERQQLRAILKPLLQSSSERDAEAAIFKLDGWLERNHAPQSEKEMSLADFNARDSDAATFKTIENTTQKSPTIPQKDRPRKIPIARLASLVSLGALIIVLGWTWYRANRAPEKQTASRLPAATQTENAPALRKRRTSSRVGAAKVTTETAGRKPNAKKPFADTQDELPPNVSHKPAIPDQNAIADPMEKTDDNARSQADPVPTEQTPVELIPIQPVIQVAEVPPPDVKVEQPVPNVAGTENQQSAPSIAKDASIPLTAARSGPFAKMPSTVNLLEIGVNSERTLGQIDPGSNFLLACSLLTDDALTRRTQFTLEREAGDQSQAWTVIGDTSAGQRTPIAKLALVGNELKFQWLVNPVSAVNYSFLCNCLLAMQAGDEKYLLRLRMPVKIGSATVTAEEPQAKLSFDLDAFPLESAAVTTEFLKIDEVSLAKDDDDFTWLIEPEDQHASERAPLFVYMTDLPDRFLFLEITSKIAKKSEITATLRIQQNPKPKPYSEKIAGELDAYLKSMANEIGNTYQQALAYEAPDGKKRDHAKLVKELKGQLESAQQQIVDLATQKRRASALISQPIRCRVYFTLEDTEIDLATWDGNPHPVK